MNSQKIFRIKIFLRKNPSMILKTLEHRIHYKMVPELFQEFRHLINNDENEIQEFMIFALQSQTQYFGLLLQMCNQKIMDLLLNYAVLYGFETQTEYLLMSGADPNKITLFTVENRVNNLIISTTINYNLKITNLLIHYGADVMMCNHLLPKDMNLLEYLLHSS